MHDESRWPIEEQVRQNFVMDAVLLKAKWAQDHLADLDGAIDVFFNQSIRSNPYVVFPERDPKTGDRIYRFHGADKFPRAIPGLVGDILFNLRSALDHLAWQLVLANGCNPSTRTYFPIVEDPLSKDGKTKFARMVAGMRQETIEAIKRLKPHKGGNDNLWLLHELNRIDKHREILGLGSSHVGHTALPSQQRQILETWKKSHPDIESAPDVSGIMVSAPVVQLLKPGDILRVVPEAEYDPHMEFQVEVSFDVPGVVEGKSLINTLNAMKNAVIKIICDFRTDGHFRIGL